MNAEPEPLNLAWVKIDQWEGVVLVGERHITQFGGDAITPIPENLVFLQRLTPKGIKFDIEAAKIVNELSQLFKDRESMADCDAAEFVDQAGQIFELVLKSREAIKELRP